MSAMRKKREKQKHKQIIETGIKMMSEDISNSK